MNDISQEEKDIIHRQHVAEAQAHLETLMGKAGLPEASREHLRDVFRGVSFTAGMKTACNVQMRMGVPK